MLTTSGQFLVMFLVAWFNPSAASSDMPSAYSQEPKPFRLELYY
jgi:hypothetical protein